MRHTIVLSTAFTLIAATFATAQVHEGDVQLKIVDNKITTFDASVSPAPQSVVFAATFGEIFPGFTDNPGFDSLPGTFTSGTRIGFNILDALRKWDSSDFDAIPVETISVGFGPAAPVVTPATADTVVPGFTLVVPSSGQWHRHLEYTLDAPASDGVYLLKMELFTDQIGIAKTDPFYFVFNQNVSAEIHGAAIDYVKNSIVPEPASLGLLAMGGLGLLRRRRTHRA